MLFIKNDRLLNIIQMKYILILLIFAACNTTGQPIKETYSEPHRPQIHFSPKSGWMNDPNGMVFFNGKYHLFFQHNPDSTVWGPMHWGHAVSTDLVHWEELPIALYPDTLGTIFSGSAVIDVNNTAGFGKNAMIAIYTNHSHELEKTGTDKYQTQGIAYSTDEGKTWSKYSGNPVVQNPGIRDFRDPKVFWYETDKKWIMTLATLDHITFYSSPDLKNWKEESEFGKEVGAHGGVWECPDLFPLDYGGKTIWILLVSINPGGPNGGSATQYFTGNFDGKTFSPFDTHIRWVDFGPDDYAGVTWSNTGERKIFMGWMSNWQYANVVPTKVWRSAMTVPRDLKMVKTGTEFLLASQPVPELNQLNEDSVLLKDVEANDYDLTAKTGKLTGPWKLVLTADKIQSFSITLSNKQGEKLSLGFDKANNHYFIDRSQSGNIDFERGFAARHTASRLATHQDVSLTLLIDEASVELFADGGLSVMTEIFFPNERYTGITIQSPENFKVNQLQFYKLKKIWK